MEVYEVSLPRGTEGNMWDPARTVQQYWSTEGRLLAEADPLYPRPERWCVRQRRQVVLGRRLRWVGRDASYDPLGRLEGFFEDEVPHELAGPAPQRVAQGTLMEVVLVWASKGVWGDAVDPVRDVFQYWSKTGEFLAQHDCLFAEPGMSVRAAHAFKLETMGPELRAEMAPTTPVDDKGV
jgi:hypothetical protein